MSSHCEHKFQRVTGEIHKCKFCGKVVYRHTDKRYKHKQLVKTEPKRT